MSNGGSFVMISKRNTVALVVLYATTVVAETPLDPAKQWGQWRGPAAHGVAKHGNPPVKWSEAENIRWKVQIPGHGLSTPLVWGQAVYLQTAISTDPDATRKRVEEQETRQN